MENRFDFSLEQGATGGDLIAVCPDGERLWLTAGDRKNMAEIARRWNAFPVMLAALERIARTRDELVAATSLDFLGGYSCFDDWAADVASNAVAKATIDGGAV